MKAATAITSLICFFTFGAFAGMAQTLTCTFQFIGSGTIGTQSFTNATITITTVANTANRQPFPPNEYYIANDSVSILISGIGTFQFTSPQQTKTDANNVGFSNNLPPGALNSGEVFISFFITNGGQIRGTVNPASNPWLLLTPIGPLTLGYTISGWNLIPVSTTGGILNLYDGGSGMLTFQAAGASATPPPPTLSRTGVLSHIAAGGGWTSAITLVNASSAALPVTVALHNDDGSAMPLPVTTTQQGVSQTTTTSSLNATINPNATLLMSMGSQLTSTVVGWADVLSSGSLGGYAIFRTSSPNSPVSEGTVPLQTQFPSTFTLPYDNTAGFTMGVALANLSTSTANITATIWDDSGNQLGTQFITIAGSGHTAFVLPNQFAVTAGRRGIVKFQSAAMGGISGIGLRFSPYGTFTSVPTM